MKRILLFLALWAGLISSAFAQGGMGPGPGTVHSSGGGGGGCGYCGPGDLATWTMWWGMRAFSEATLGNDAIILQRISDSAFCTVKTKSTGDLDLTVTNSCTGGTQTVTAFCASTTCVLTAMLDQTGNGFDIAPDGGTPVPFSFSCQNSKPCAQPNNFAYHMKTRTTTWTQSQPFTGVSVSRRTGSTSVASTVMQAVDVSIASSGFIGYNTSANAAFIYSGTSSSNVTASDASAHLLIGVFNGSSSILTVDSTDTTGLSVGTHVPTASTVFLFEDGFGDNMAGNWMEGGNLAGAMSGTERTNLHTNVSAYWATP